MISNAIGIDLGGSHITGIVMGRNGVVISKETVEVTSDRSISTIICHIVRIIEKIITPDVIVIGLGIPGNVDPLNGCTTYLPNFQWLDSVPIGRLIQEKFGIPVELRNDGRCAALAEYHFGAGISSKVFAMLTLGTGIGGALIVNGRLFEGR